ncbi:MAG TPA: FKBP-type peptidyl-prolyl cis-trans isomerase [Rhodanobacteraceae bacterium]|nr:FKBP-type peptidyl-prolyl cis-trans isomerase [Rhodanobacteraceae bacterium]
MRTTLIAIAVLALAACSGSPPPTATGQVEQLKIIDQKIGTGQEAKPGMKVTVDYTGWLYDANAPDKHGTKFDSSSDHGQHFTFTLGAGQVIAGWDKGVAGMRVGGKRELLVPPEMGYGRRGAGHVIPPNASLVFEVTLLNIAP